MPELIVFPDLEALLVAEFAGLADDVVQSIPDDRDGTRTMLRVVLLGGASHDVVVGVPTVAIEAWAPGRTEAHELIQVARGHLHSLRMLGTVPVYRVVDLALPSWQPDPASGQPRYVLNATVSLRGAVLVGS